MLTVDAPAEIRAVLEHLYPVRKTVVRRIVNKPVLPAICDMNCDKCKNMKCSNKGGEGWFEKEVHEEVVDEEDVKPEIREATEEELAWLLDFDPKEFEVL